MFDRKNYMKEYQQIHKVEKARNSKKYRSTIKGRLNECFHRMKERCTDPRHPRYKDYGGREIRCCFNSAKEFTDYIINKLQVNPCGLQIDRIDNNGDYKPGNIQFVTAKENCNNRRNST